MTALFSGERVRKPHPRVVAYGTVDELNSQVGVARAAEPQVSVANAIAELQNVLFYLGSDLATPGDAPSVPRIREEHTARLEAEIDAMDEKLPLLKNFILPAGTLAAAHLHVARCVCRRAEREAVSLATIESINPEVVVFLNRLSDYLFVLARYENLLAKREETTWSARSNPST